MTSKGSCVDVTIEFLPVVAANPDRLTGTVFLFAKHARTRHCFDALVVVEVRSFRTPAAWVAITRTFAGLNRVDTRAGARTL